MKWYVYLLRCSDNTLYCGCSNNLEKRIAMHNSGKGSKYCRTRLPVYLEYSKECENKSEACKEEYRIKQLTKKEKEDLITINSLIKDVENKYPNCSLLNRISEHESYKKIIENGYVSIPYLLEKLNHNTAMFWIYALYKITGEDVNKDAFNSKDKIDSWKNWGIDYLRKKKIKK